MQIIAADMNDLDEITEIYTAYSGDEMTRLGFRFDRAKTRAHIAEMIEKGHVIVAEAGGHMIGFLAGVVLPCGFTEDRMFVSNLFYVKPEYRHHTIGILKKAEEFIRLSKATKFVMAIPAFEEAEKFMRFYRLQGFKTLETHVCKDLAA